MAAWGLAALGGEWQRALQLLAAAKLAKLRANNVAYNAAISACHWARQAVIYSVNKPPFIVLNDGP